MFWTSDTGIDGQTPIDLDELDELHIHPLPPHVDQLQGKGYTSSVTGMFQSNGLRTRQVAVAWYESSLLRERTSAKIQMESTIEFTAAEPAYLTGQQLALNTPYLQRRSISLAKVDGAWKITGIEKFPLTRHTPPPAS